MFNENGPNVMVAFYKVWPPECGAAVVSYHLARNIIGPVELVQLASGKGITSRPHGFKLVNISGLPENKVFKAAWIIVQLPRIVRLLTKRKPSNIIFEGAAWSFYYVVLFWLLRLFKLKCPILYHAHNVEYLLRRGKNRWLTTIIGKWSEGYLLKKANYSFAVSDVDAAIFNKLYKVYPKILPNGIDPELYEKITSQDINKIKNKYNLSNPIVLFMGLMGFAPNDEAIEYLIKKVMPIILSRDSSVRLVLLGGKAKYTFRGSKSWKDTV